MPAEEWGGWAALFTMLGTVIAAYFGFLASKHARQANRAVNQRPSHEPTIYSLVSDTRDRLIRMEFRVDDVHTRIERLENYSLTDRANRHLGTTIQEPKKQKDE